MIRFLPGPPVIVSLPPPPMRMLSPLPPVIVSLPTPATISVVGRRAAGEDVGIGRADQLVDDAEIESVVFQGAIDCACPLSRPRLTSTPAVSWLKSSVLLPPVIDDRGGHGGGIERVVVVAADLRRA